MHHIVREVDIHEFIKLRLSKEIQILGRTEGGKWWRNAFF